MLKLFEPDNETVNTGADGYVHAFKHMQLLASSPGRGDKLPGI